MKSIMSSPQFLRVTLYTVILTVVLTFSSIPQNAQRVAGDLWLTGSVTLNGTSVSSGITVLNNSQVKTGRSSSATVNLGKLGRIKLEPESELVLQFNNSLIGGNQLAGLTAISANKGIKTRVSTPHVLVEGDGADVGLVSIDVKPEYTCVVANRGAVRLTSGQKVSTLRAGEALSFDSRGPEKVSHCEGLKAAGLAKPLAVVGAVSAATLIPLTRDALSATRGTTVAQNTNTAAPQVTNQSTPPPTSTSNNNPTTPVKPPPPYSVCDLCKYDKDGKPLSNSIRVMIAHITGNDACNNLTVDCHALLGHFNLNGTPRNGHLRDQCGMCPTPPETVNVCGCEFKKNGDPVDGSKLVMIRHYDPNLCRMIEVSCQNLLTHFTPGGLPRPGHEKDGCTGCKL